MDYTKNQKLIALLISLHGMPTVTVMMKLAYLLDLISIKRSKNKIFDYTYRRYTYGPFDEKIYLDLKQLTEEGVIVPRSEYTPNGQEYIVFDFNSDSEIEIDITKGERELIDEVMESVKGYGAKTLTEIAYNTAPMKAFGAKLGGREHLNEELEMTA